ncbi:hypothetical protein IT570_11020 [Candidatus Sumerlaeota bacterium]|nr:hypothetical protein [Candidatus Sumerlaeota bacterium]
MKKHLMLTAMLALASGAAVALTPTVDGQSITALEYGPALALQTATATGFGPTLQAAELFVTNDATNLYIGVAGNNDNGGSGFYVFIDAQAGGSAEAATDTSGGYGEFDQFASAGGGNMPTGFTFDQALVVASLGDGGHLGSWDRLANTATYRGGTGAHTGGYDAAINNSNADILPYVAGGSDTGVEFQVPLTTIGSPASGTPIKIFVVAGNTNNGGSTAVYLSNMVLPSDGTPGNYGRDGAGGGSGNGTNFDGVGGPNITPATYTIGIGTSVSDWTMIDG